MSVEIQARGNLGSNIVYKTITRKDNNDTGEVLNFSIASTDYQRKFVDGQETFAPGNTEWIECEYWHKNAKQVAQIMQKGMPVTITGREMIHFYEKNGQQVKTRRIRVDRLYLNLESTRIESITLKPTRSEQNSGE